MTYKQRLFVAYYLGESRGNATDAARRAGFAWPDKVGAQLLGKTRIRAAIDAKLAEVAMPQEEILARLTEVAGGDISALIAIEGDTWRFDLRKIRRHGRIIRKLKATRDGSTELELEPKLAALIKLGEYHGMWNRGDPIPAGADGRDEDGGATDEELDGWAAAWTDTGGLSADRPVQSDGVRGADDQGRDPVSAPSEAAERQAEGGGRGPADAPRGDDAAAAR